jgi:NitT/TauT family transport system substrate-binding protein
VPFVIVAPSALAALTGSYSGLIVPKDSPIQTARDLNGKTVSVPALHDIESLGTQTWIDKNGGDSKTVSFVEEPVTAVGISLDANRIAAGIMTNPALAQAMATGKYRRLARPVEEGFNHLMIAAWVSTTGWTAKNAGVVRRFGQVMKAATLYANAHPDKTVDLIAAFSGTARAAIAAMTRATYATTLDPSLVQPLIDATARYGAIPQPFNAAELFSPLAFGYSPQ